MITAELMIDHLFHSMEKPQRSNNFSSSYWAGVQMWWSLHMFSLNLWNKHFQCIYGLILYIVFFLSGYSLLKDGKEDMGKLHPFLQSNYKRIIEREAERFETMCAASKHMQCIFERCFWSNNNYSLTCQKVFKDPLNPQVIWVLSVQTSSVC